MANFARRYPDQSSTATDDPQDNPLTFTTDEFEVRGWEWVELLMKLTDNVDAVNATMMIEYADETVTDWRLITVEEIDRTTGIAIEVPYQPRRSIEAGDTTWAVPVPVHGTKMRFTVTFDVAPGSGSELRTFYRRR